MKTDKYFVYCRKSSEAEDKQVQSNEDQERELNEFIQKNGLEIVSKPFKESQSAHHPGRPIFNDLMKRISKGEANGLLVWHANRVSRNPVDSGMVIHLIDEQKLVHVRTLSHIYGNTSTEKMMLALEFMMSKKDSDDKSEAVKRGLGSRYLKGYPNGVAPIGFMNDLSKEKGNRGWVVDREKLNLVKQLLKKFGTGNYPAREITRMSWAMGLLSPRHKRQGGKKLGDSYIHGTLLKSPVYAGFFFDKNGVRHELNQSVPRIITEEEYWHNQKLLGKRGRPRPSVNKDSFTYVGTAVCGNCGGSITAEHKYQLICSKCKHKFAYQNRTHCPKCGIAIGKMKNPKYLHYIYNHCTKKRTPNCPEGSMREDEIDQSLAAFFRENLCMSEALAKWCSDNIKTLDNDDVQNEFERKASLEKVLTDKKNQEKKLALMCAQGMLEDKDFMDAREAVKGEIRSLEAELASIGRWTRQGSSGP